MDNQPNENQEVRAKPLKQPSPWLPYIVSIVGSVISIMIWHAFISETYTERFMATSLKMSLPWILLVIGIAASILVGVVIHLIQVSHDRSRALRQIDQDFKKEINERILAEETKQKLEIALLQGQKLQAIGTLAGGIAHDFNNILYAIIGYVEMAREDAEKESLIYKNLGKVLEAAHRGQDLVARILAFGRRHIHHEHKPIHIQTILESVLALLRPTIPASVIIELKGVDKDIIILGDQTQLHQVIVNIINNAIDAMDGEGTVVIDISKISAYDDYLKQFPDSFDKNYCRINITDTGHGMDLSTMERIFEPFFTTKEVGKGTGLGLATVHAIMKDHKGEISVTSQLGTGTTFTLLLPEYQGTIE